MSSDRVIVEALKVAQVLLCQNLPPKNNLTDGEPEDIANAGAFLASPESGWITAQVLTVDGGWMDYIGHG
jgi:NAD(P)-dependent dehydrogenase (short-subunit alcohol dehydrogenase family)